MTFSSYLKYLRIRYAKILLRRSLKEIKEISFEIGYKDISHFYHDFKYFTGKTPFKYRMKCRKYILQNFSRTLSKKIYSNSKKSTKEKKN